MSSNYATRAILALKIPERQLRVLLGLETVTRAESGWREIGTELLASYAGVSVTTVTRARRDLVAPGLIEYRRGDGKGHPGAYRIKVPGVDDHHAGGQVEGGHNADHLEGGPNADHLPGPAKVVRQAPQRWSGRPRKGSQANAAASGNASAVLRPYVLKQSVPDPGAAHPDPRTLLLGLGADEHEIDPIRNLIAETTGRDPGEYLWDQIGGHGQGRGHLIVRRARRKLGLPEPGPRRAPPCPDCGEPYSAEQLADPEFHSKAMAGTAGCTH